MELEEFSGIDKEKESVVITENAKTETIHVHVCQGTVYPNEIPEHQKDIIEALAHHNVKYSEVAMFGDWAVNEDGDIININRKCARYPVYRESYENSEDSVLEQLEGKGWFYGYQKETFLQALTYAKIQLDNKNNQ